MQRYLILGLIYASSFDKKNETVGSVTRLLILDSDIEIGWMFFFILFLLYALELGLPRGDIGDE